MAILVTGGAGYIGSHMAHALCDRGERVVVLDDLSTGFRDAVPPAARFVEGSTGDEALVGAIIRESGIDAIVHFAASIVVPESVAHPLAYYRNNTANARTLIEAAVNGGVHRFVFSSTAAVYGEPEHSPVAETAPLNPQSPYGSSKLMTEIMLRDTGRAHDLRHVVLRYFNVAGADPAGHIGQSTRDATHLIKAATQTALGLRERMTVFGTDFPTPDGTGVRDYIHVSDLVEAHLAALAYLQGGGASDTFNCGYGRGFSVLEVLAAVKRASGTDFAVEMAPRRPGDPASVVADSGHIRSKLGWTPRFDDLDTIVGHALAWERKLHGGPR